DDPTRVVPRGGSGMPPAPGRPSGPPVPDPTRVLDEVVPPQQFRPPAQPPGYPPPPPLYRDDPAAGYRGGAPQYAAPGAAGGSGPGQNAPYRSPEPPPRSAPPQHRPPQHQPPQQREATRPPDVEPPRRAPREPREPRPSRGRGFRPTSVPGVGCLSGCLMRMVMTLVIMAAGLVALYYLTPLHTWIDSALDVFDEVKGWYEKAKDFFDGGGDKGTGETGGTNGLPTGLPKGIPTKLP
ncbi:hypothetical protein LZ495_34325, partial [Yinghuangia sp. KLBMP8922]|nr:hypothetical protein [Yinghuangia soli]